MLRELLQHPLALALSILGHLALIGGAGSAVVEWVNGQRQPVTCIVNGLGDNFPAQGSRQQVLQDYHLDAEHLDTKLKTLFD